MTGHKRTLIKTLGLLFLLMTVVFLIGNSHVTAYPLLTDVELDPTFGTQGVAYPPVKEDYGTGYATYLSNGSLFLLGHYYSDISNGRSEAIHTFRITNSGEWDQTYGEDGRLTFDLDNEIMGVGEVFDAENNDYITFGEVRNRPSSTNLLTLLRFLRDGTIDPRFGTNGKLLIPVSGCGFRDLASQSDGKFLLLYSCYPEYLEKYLPDGKLDTSFGNNGRVEGVGELLHNVTDVDVDHKGNIYVLGTSWTDQAMGVERYFPNGERDDSFGMNGTAFAYMGTDIQAREMLITSDGKLLLSGAPDFGLARLLPEGDLDLSFDEDGVLVMQHPAPFGTTQVTIDHQERIILGLNNYNYVYRLHPDGTLDNSFGTNGVAYDYFTGVRPDSILVDSDDNVYLGSPYDAKPTIFKYTNTGAVDSTFGNRGYITIRAYQGNSLLRDHMGNWVGFGSHPNPVLVRLNSTGIPDRTFGNDGIIEGGSLPFSEVTDAIQDLENRIVRIMRVDSWKFLHSMVRFLPDGTYDPSFGNGGIMPPPPDIGLRFYSVAESPPMGYVTAGVIWDPKEGSVPQETMIPMNYMLARITYAGSLDPTFGSNGTTNQIYCSVTPESQIQIEPSIAQDPEGNWLLAAPCLRAPDSKSIVVRYTSAGVLDTSFGVNGITVLGELNYTHDMKLQSDGRILVVGHIIENKVVKLAVARLTPQGALDTSFGENGITSYLIPNENQSYTDVEGSRILLQNNGSIIIAGYAFNYPYRQDGISFLVRFLTNGNVDNNFGINGYRNLPEIRNLYDAIYTGSNEIVVTGQSSFNNLMVIARYRMTGEVEATATPTLTPTITPIYTQTSVPSITPTHTQTSVPIPTSTYTPNSYEDLYLPLIQRYPSQQNNE